MTGKVIYMNTNVLHSKEKTFYGVAIALIIVGAAIFVVGAIQALLQTLAGWGFGWPFGKVIGGLIILGMGYVILQLELLRTGLKPDPSPKNNQ